MVPGEASSLNVAFTFLTPLPPPAPAHSAPLPPQLPHQQLAQVLVEGGGEVFLPIEQAGQGAGCRPWVSGHGLQGVELALLRQCPPQPMHASGMRRGWLS